MTLKELLTTPEVNSRFIYLLTSVTVCVSIFTLVVAFMLTESKTLYPEMVGILLAGGIGGAAGRWIASKKQAAEETKP